MAIVTFSHAGENLVGGQIQNVQTGLTQQVATQLAQRLDATAYQIRACQPYPVTFNQTLVRAKAESQLTAAYPKVVLAPVDVLVEDSVLYLGYPNWFGTIPTPVASWLSQQLLAGVTIYPFCTHEGGGLGRSMTDIQRLCPDADLQPGLPIRSTRVHQSAHAIDIWLSNH